MFLSLIRYNEIQNVLSDHVIYKLNGTNEVIVRIKIKILGQLIKTNNR